MKWVKSSHRLPKEAGYYHTNLGLIELGLVRGGNNKEWRWLNTGGATVYNWLDESEDEWISANQSLPEEGKHCWVSWVGVENLPFSHDLVAEGKWLSKDRSGYYRDGFMSMNRQMFVFDPTYWKYKQIPEPPKL